MFPVALRGDRVLLREMEPRDFDAIHRYAVDPEVVRYTLWGPNDAQATQDYLDAAIASARRAEREEYTLAVERAGELAGAAHLAVRSLAHRRGEIGYVVRRDLWGQGIAGEAAGLLLRLGFEHLGLHRIEATCDPANAASRRVLERIGMRREGHLRENYRAHGRWRDSLLYGLLQGEWTGFAQAGRHAP